mgnify:CR=1 FL=1
MIRRGARCALGARQRDGGVVFVTEDALKRVQPDMRFDEPGLLGAFDANRALIYAAAAKVYARGRKGSYDLVDADF